MTVLPNVFSDGFRGTRSGKSTGDCGKRRQLYKIDPLMFSLKLTSLYIYWIEMRILFHVCPRWVYLGTNNSDIMWNNLVIPAADAGLRPVPNQQQTGREHCTCADLEWIIIAHCSSRCNPDATTDAASRSVHKNPDLIFRFCLNKLNKTSVSNLHFQLKLAYVPQAYNAGYAKAKYNSLYKLYIIL